MRIVYSAAVEILVEAKSQSEAFDIISSLLSENELAFAGELDWAYLNIGGRYLYPTPSVMLSDWYMRRQPGYEESGG